MDKQQALEYAYNWVSNEAKYKARSFYITDFENGYAAKELVTNTALACATLAKALAEEQYAVVCTTLPDNEVFVFVSPTVCFYGEDLE